MVIMVLPKYKVWSLSSKKGLVIKLLLSIWQENEHGLTKLKPYQILATNQIEPSWSKLPKFIKESMSTHVLQTKTALQIRVPPLHTQVCLG